MSILLSSLIVVWRSSRAIRLRSRRLGRLDDKLIPEASGIVKSRRYPGIFWVHNDSGNPPLLFAIRGDGRIVRQFRLGDPQHRLGRHRDRRPGASLPGRHRQQLGALPLRAIYRIDEPDPTSPADKPLSASAVTFYALPRENRFDAESLFYDRGSATLVAKYPMVAKPSCSRFRSSPPRPCSDRPGLVRSADCPDSPSPRRAPI